jgi:hypothetical protein
VITILYVRGWSLTLDNVDLDPEIIDDSRKCFSSRTSYQKAYFEWKSYDAPHITTITSRRVTYRDDAGAGTLYTDHDGVTRLSNFIPTGTTQITFVETTTIVDLDAKAIIGGKTFPQAKPTCSVHVGACDQIRESWTKAQARSSTLPGILVNDGRGVKLAGWDKGQIEVCRGKKCRCEIRGKNIALIYWPSINHNTVSYLSPHRHFLMYS